MAKRCMIAVDIQNFYRPSPGIVQQINQLATTMPTAATVFRHDENQIPLAKLGRPVPQADSTMAMTNVIFDKFGYGLPESAIIWLKNQAPEEVLIVGGHTDANVMSVGFSVFNAGFTPAIIPLLCYGNDWYMHTVTVKIWENEIGKVYQSLAEFQFGGL